MMSSNENIKFRSIPNQEIVRPLSTYDNLNNESKLNGSNASENDCIDRGENANEFPFTGISFRFDELKQLNQNAAPTIHSSNGYDNINNNNYKLHRNNNSNSNGNNNNHQNINNGTFFNGNVVNQIRSNQGHNTVTTIAQNHSSSSSSSTTSNSSSSSSSENGYKHSSLQYANLSGNPIANRGLNKPVHSPAKSQFLGLHKTNDNEPNNVENKTNGSTSKPQNGDKSGQDESLNVSDEEPLLNGYGNRIITSSPNRSTNNNTSQYQNIPSNSSCYGQNQIDDANECCTCTCKNSDPATEIRQYESDRYMCNGCLTSKRNSNTASISIVPISTMNVPSCSKTVDLSSCTTSMKPAKSTPLDTSSSFRMNQSSLSQVI